MLVERLSGLSINDEQIHESLRQSGLKGKAPHLWTDSHLLNFASNLRLISKPSIIVANKSDLSSSKSNINRIKENNKLVIPCAAEAELLLRRATAQGLINYLPGEKLSSEGDSYFSLGGSEINTSISLSKQNNHVYLVSSLPDNKLGQEFLDILRQNHIQIQHVHLSRDHQLIDHSILILSW